MKKDSDMQISCHLGIQNKELSAVFCNSSKDVFKIEQPKNYSKLQIPKPHF